MNDRLDEIKSRHHEDRRKFPSLKTELDCDADREWLLNHVQTLKDKLAAVDKWREQDTAICRAKELEAAIQRVRDVEPVTLYRNRSDNGDLDHLLAIPWDVFGKAVAALEKNDE